MSHEGAKAMVQLHFLESSTLSDLYQCYSNGRLDDNKTLEEQYRNSSQMKGWQKQS